MEQPREKPHLRLRCGLWICATDPLYAYQDVTPAGAYLGWWTFGATSRDRQRVRRKSIELALAQQRLDERTIAVDAPHGRTHG